MITAIDTNVLSDVLSSSSDFGERAQAHLKAQARRGGLVTSVVVFAELLGMFRDAGRLRAKLRELGVSVQPLDEETAALAGLAWRAYRERGGGRERMLADFLIGAHASVNAGRLLTRDRGYFRTYFGDLELIDAGLEAS